MSVAANEIRQFWMPGLNEVVGKQKSGLVKWLSLGECYYVSSPLSQNQFSWDLSGRGFSNKMLLAFAYDCNRMASAAFETMWSIEKSTNYLIIHELNAWFPYDKRKQNFEDTSVNALSGSQTRWISI